MPAPPFKMSLKSLFAGESGDVVHSEKQVAVCAGEVWLVFDGALEAIQGLADEAFHLVGGAEIVQHRRTVRGELLRLSQRCAK